MKQKHIILISVIVFIVALILGIVYFGLGSNKTSANEKVIIKDNVKVISADAEELPIMDADYRLIIYDESSYEVGDILVSEITPNAPNGYIRRVLNIVKEDYYYVLETEPALITDVFEEVHIKKTFLLTDDGANDVSGENGKHFKSGIKDVLKNLLIDTYYADETEDNKKYQLCA